MTKQFRHYKWTGPKKVSYAIFVEKWKMAFGLVCNLDKDLSAEYKRTYVDS